MSSSCFLDSLTDGIHLLATYLSTDELECAANYRFESDRTQFIRARGALRYLLGLYLCKSPTSRQFLYGQRGKPGLSWQEWPSRLSFNLSRSEDLCLIAPTCGSRVGVDAEFARPLPERQKIMDEFFSAVERRCIQEAQENANQVLYQRLNRRALAA